MQKPHGGKPTVAEVRSWARDNGHTVPARGRLRAGIWTAWHAAHPTCRPDRTSQNRARGHGVGVVETGAFLLEGPRCRPARTWPALGTRRVLLCRACRRHNTLTRYFSPLQRKRTPSRTRTRRNRHYSQSPPPTSRQRLLLMIGQHISAHHTRIPTFPQELVLTILRSLQRVGHASTPAPAAPTAPDSADPSNCLAGHGV
ncbi:Lsr2 family DNA-binding protein [Streptomyces atratus]